MKTGSKSKHVKGSTIQVERVQTGIRIEARMLKVLKGLAEYLDVSVGELIEGIVLHAFEGQLPFKDETQKAILALKQVYGMDYGISAAHHFIENRPSEENQNDRNQA